MESHSFYQQAELERAKAAEKRIGVTMAVVAGAGLALCVLLCCFVTRKNQGLLRPLTIGISLLAGWIVIFLSHSRYDRVKAQVHGPL